jgi:HSP20 family protein
MALVVIGALVSSTALTLVVVPALYSLLDDLQARLFGRKRRAFEVVAPPAQPAEKPVAPVSHHDGRDGVPMNVIEANDVYLVRAALPGIREEDVEVSIHGHTLTISGERRVDGAGNGSRYLVREYDTGRWQRTMALPQEVESAGVRASYEDGILEVRLPKAAPDSARKVPINGQADPPG